MVSPLVNRVSVSRLPCSDLTVAVRWASAFAYVRSIVTALPRPKNDCFVGEGRGGERQKRKKKKHA